MYVSSVSHINQFIFMVNVFHSHLSSVLLFVILLKVVRAVY